MKFFSLLLRLFPYSFAQQMGQAWISANEQLWQSSRGLGFSARTALALRLALDCLLHIPRAHAQAIRSAIAGPIPQMTAQGAGVVSIALAYSGYVVSSVRKGGNSFMFSMSFGVFLGAVLSSLTLLLAYNYILPHQDDAFLTRHLQTQLSYGYTFLAVGSFMFLAWSLPKAYRYLRFHRGPLLSKFIALLMGFYSTLLVFILISVNSMSLQYMEPFYRFPITQNLVVPRPAFGEPMTVEQSQWFDPQSARLLEDKKQEWCTIHSTWNSSERNSILNSSSADVIRALLYLGMERRLVEDGCQTAQQYFEKATSLAQSLRYDRDPTRVSWTMLSKLSWVHSQLSAAHYIVWPRLHEDATNSCLVIADELLYQGKITRSHGMNLYNVCAGIDKELGPLGQEVGQPDWSRLPPSWLISEKIKTLLRSTAHTRVLSHADHDLIRTKLLEKLGST